MNIKQINIIKMKRKKKFWFQHNQDAQGYPFGDNRITGPSSIPLDRREVVRRTWNF